jgi:hypothetical protein
MKRIFAAPQRFGIALMLGLMMTLIPQRSGAEPINAGPLKEQKAPVSLPKGVGADWLTAAQKSIAKEEYIVSITDCELPVIQDSSSQSPARCYQAPNRAHDLRTYFTDRGPRVVRKTEKEPSWVWGLEFVGLRMDGADSVPPVSNVETNGNRIEFHRQGGVVEWYVNDPKGLEQGFTISEPAISDPPSAIVLDLAVRGDLSAGMMPDGKTIEFLNQSGVGLIHYGGLKVLDAGGKELPARMELTALVETGSPQSAVHNLQSTIRLVVDTAGAQYPVTIDPLATSAAWTAESNQAGALSGGTVATAGDVNGDGYSDILIGAPYYDNGQTDEGRVFVYHGSASGLSGTPNWTVESNQANAHLGGGVATAGDVNGDGYSDVIVSAADMDNGETDEGMAFVYLGSASGLSSTPAWTAEGNQAGAQFAYDIGTAGDVNGDGYSDVIVGAMWYDNDKVDQGRAYAYYGSASGLSATANWIVDGEQAGEGLGGRVCTAGDVNTDGYSDVLTRGGGYSNGQTSEGIVLLYYGSSSGLSTSPDWSAESNQANAVFGFPTAGDVNGDGYSDIVIGCPSYDNGETDEGVAFIYYGSASGPGAGTMFGQGNQTSAAYGYVSTAGDVNGDGYADIVVGAREYDNGQTNEGIIYLYLGSSSGLVATPAWSAEGNQSNAWFGVCNSTAGDVNGDGYSDVLVAAP